ncbi:hypothetical protein NMG60_11002133 [Bertholletia excelsa]
MARMLADLKLFYERPFEGLQAHSSSLSSNLTLFDLDGYAFLRNSITIQEKNRKYRRFLAHKKMLSWCISSKDL